MKNRNSVNGHTVSPVHSGQREAPVKMASQPRQNSARSSEIGPWS